MPLARTAASEATTSKRVETLLAGIELVARSTRYVSGSGIAGRADDASDVGVAIGREVVS